MRLRVKGLMQPVTGAVALAAAALVAGLWFAQARSNTPAAASRPNIVVILADDLGYGDTSVYGSKTIQTPNIDALAASGIRFTAGYVTNPVCAPSRAALMTGRYQQRFGYEFNPNGRDRAGGMSLNEITLAQIMKSAGYATGAIGKWHLGQPDGYYPSDRGFDYFFGMSGGGTDYITNPAPGDEFIGPGGEDIKVPAAGLSALSQGERLKSILQRIREKSPITRNHQLVRVDDYLTEALTREAVGFIDRNRTRPFFLYLAQHVPHAPLQAPKKYIDRYQNVQDPYKRVHAAMVSALDDSVGDVITTLKKDGLYQNTLVIFLSDNGCPLFVYGACSNAPLSGGKRWQLEGGIRIPYIVSWPGHLSAGRVDNRQVSSLDILPTAAALAQTKLPSDRVYDGVNLLPYLNGADRAVPNPKLYWRDGPNFAMRDADLKLWLAAIAPQGADKRAKSGEEPDDDADEEGSSKVNKLSKSGKANKRSIPPTVGPEGQHVMLFDLDHDISEKNNLAASRAGDVARLKDEINQWNKMLVKPMWPDSKHSTIDYDGENLQVFY